MTPRELLQQFQAVDKYARFRDEWGRRETWSESVARSMTWLDQTTGGVLPREDIRELRAAMLAMEVLPSMRLVSMGGPAADRDHSHIYNCQFIAADALIAFREAILSAMAGVGVSFSVERMHVSRLPVVRLQSGKTLRHTVADSAEGWAEAVDVGITSWYTGHDVAFDLSRVRPAGAILRTKGGRASGPEPLRKLLERTREIILAAQGRQLRPIELYDIMCWIGWASVSGGVRHTAMAVLFDWDDAEMRQAKSASYYRDAGLMARSKRELANGSTVITQPLSYEQWREFLLTGPLGTTGEPNFFNRWAALNTMPPRRRERLSDYHKATLGVNVCGEVVLIPQQFCNLTMLALKPDVSRAEIERRVRLATILGVMQAKCTYFPRLRQEWRSNAEDDVILGVCPSGWMSNADAMQGDTMRAMRDTAVGTAREYAELFGIRTPGAVTSVKPAGNSSLLTGTQAGIHPDAYAYSKRHVTVQKTSPLLPVLERAGVPIVPLKNPAAVYAVFPMQAQGKPRSEMTALEQLETHLRVKRNYCEHNVSQTVTFRTGEEDGIVAWLYEHQAEVVGVTFLRDDGNVYDEAPIQEIDRATYARMVAAFPADIDWAQLNEAEDYTQHVTGCDGERCLL